MDINEPMTKFNHGRLGFGLLSVLVRERCMARLTDGQLLMKGTAVVVKNVEDLVIYQGKLNPKLSPPCDNWFEDDDPPNKVPRGLIAIRQRKTGCLAFLEKKKSNRGKYDKENWLSELLWFIPDIFH